MSTHTPGPWTFISSYEAKQNYCFEIAEVNLWRIVPDREHTSIDQEGDDISDAYLIAAAPTLLKALEDLLKATAALDICPGTIQQAKAAVIKAKGVRVPFCADESNKT